MAAKKGKSVLVGKKGAKIKWSRWMGNTLIAACAVCLLLGTVMIAGGALLVEFNYNHNSALEGATNEQLGIQPGADKDSSIINIALFGVDSRNPNSFRGLSDCVMILSIDKAHNKIKLTSVMRDSLVYIDGYRPNKINSAYALGGPELAIKTLNINFNLNIRDYATINFAGMADVIDAMGGIEAEITQAERKDANTHIKWMNIESGTPRNYIESFSGKTATVHLNGIQAVAYARIRHVSTADGQSNDFGRTDRQRYVLEQLFNKVTTMSLGEYPAVIKALLPYMETSLTYSEILGFSDVLVGGGIQLTQERVPSRQYVINMDFRGSGSSSVYYNLDYATGVIHSFIYDDIGSEEYIANNPVNKTEWYK